MTCAIVDCHIGTPPTLESQAIQLELPDGFTYTPGVTQRVTVRVQDATAQVFGFSLSSRQADLSQAGTLATANTETLIQTQAGIQYISHNLPKPAGTWMFDWTPPATSIGPVTLYVAANLANGDGQNTGDRIHLRQFTVNPAGAAPPRPTISEGGVVHGASFLAAQGIGPNGFGSVFGANLATQTTAWDDAFMDGKAPTVLAGTRVFVNGKPAFISFILRGSDFGVDYDQINFVAAEDDASGPVSVEVETEGGRSEPAIVQFDDPAPGFFPFEPEGRRYIAAIENNGAYLCAPDNLFGGPVNGRPVHPARPGDILALFGTSFGPTSPPVPVGEIPTVISSLDEAVRVMVGDVEAQVHFAGLSQYVGLYQLVITVPDLPDGEHAIRAETQGKQTQDGLFLVIRRAP